MGHFNMFDDGAVRIVVNSNLYCTLLKYGGIHRAGTVADS